MVLMKVKVKQEEELCDMDFTDEEVIDASPTSVYFGKFDAKLVAFKAFCRSVYQCFYIIM